MGPNDAAPDRGLGLTPAEIVLGEGPPRAFRYDDVYFSDQGLAESRHVFIQGNDLVKRWRNWDCGRAFVVAELGLGTARNILLAWQIFSAVAPRSARLHLVSIDKHPVAARDLERIWGRIWEPIGAGHAVWAEHVARLVGVWPEPARGVHRRALDARVTLDLVFDDVLAALAGFDGRADAWFIDGFAPSRNPRMWQADVLDAIAAASRSGATFATYSSAGAVRRGLTAAGFVCCKRAGSGRKRETLAGYLPSSPREGGHPRRSRRPWCCPPRARPARRIAVVGAGIAGAAAAEALARRGREIFVYDPLGAAGGASGNPQAALYIRPAAQVDARTRFYLGALDYTLAWLAHIDPERSLWSDCGLLQLAISDREATRQARCVERLGLPEAVLQRLGAAAAADCAGAVLSSSIRGGLYYPRAGWVQPDALCRRLLGRAGAAVRETAVTGVFAHAGGWLVKSRDGGCQTFDQVILACGSAASALSGDLPPLEPVRGQISRFDLAGDVRRHVPRPVVCGRGYVMPPLGGQLCLGASFAPEATGGEPDNTEDRDNVAMLAQILPALAARLGHEPTASRVGWRCVSTDRLPCVGPVPDSAAWRRDYADLARDATQAADVAGAVRPGLWVSTAHGSQGLVSAPLAAEILAARICDEPMPLAADLVDALNPGRWLIREIIRGR